MEPAQPSTGTLLQIKADIAARIDRLPTTRLQWTWLIAIQLVYGITVGAVDGMPARIYPYIWLPAPQISRTNSPTWWHSTSASACSWGSTSGAISVTAEDGAGRFCSPQLSAP